MGRVGRALVCGVVALGVTTVATQQVHGADSSVIVPCTKITGMIPPSHATSAAVTLPFSVNFYGATYKTAFVNNNGNLTFTAPQHTVTPFTLVAKVPPMIAPFFADVDTRASGSGLTKYGTTTYEGHAAFCVDWGDPNGKGVGYFNGHADKLNTFQLLLVQRSDRRTGDFDAVFDYGTLTWESGDASGGVHGLGGCSAGAGFTNGDHNPSNFYQIIGSGEPGAFLGTSEAPSSCSAAQGDGAVPFAQRHGLAVTSFESDASLGEPVPGRYEFKITNGAPAEPNVSLGSGAFYEGDSGQVTHDVSVTLDNPSAAPVKVYYTVTRGSGGTATPGSDFVAEPTPQLLDLPQRFAGLTATTGLIPVTILGDTKVEGNETFTVTLTNAAGAVLDPHHPVSRLVSIVDDDPGTGLRVAVDSLGMFEGNTVATVGGTNKLSFVVSLSRPLPLGSKPVTVECRLTGVTATKGTVKFPWPFGTDFINVNVPKTVTFTAGQQQTEVGALVGIVADTTHETDETFDFNLQNISGPATIQNVTGVGTIFNDD